MDFAAFPGLTAEKVRAGLAAQELVFRDQGYEPTICLVDSGDTSEAVLLAALATPPAVVVIGAGIRVAPPHFLLFERLVNVVHAHAPAAKIAFNTSPTDTVDAALRWL